MADGNSLESEDLKNEGNNGLIAEGNDVIDNETPATSDAVENNESGNANEVEGLVNPRDESSGDTMTAHDITDVKVESKAEIASDDHTETDIDTVAGEGSPNIYSTRQENDENFELPNQDQDGVAVNVETADVDATEELDNKPPISVTVIDDPRGRNIADTEEDAKLDFSESNTGADSKSPSIQIVNENIRKPYLGGFRNKLTGVEYHNASAQTSAGIRGPSSVERFHRDTQTLSSRTQMQQTFNDTSTQMTKTGCYVSNVTDKILIPKKYTPADVVAARKLEKVIVLQTHWRRWLATKYVKKLRADKIQRLEWERQEEVRKVKEREERVRREYYQRMNPKRKEDFDLLYAALEKWRLEEIEKINETRSGPEKKAALAVLLEQEAYLIQSIERHKLEAEKANKNNATLKCLDKAASSKKWRSGYDGKITEMDTPNTLRAQQLRDIYSSLQMVYLTTDERLDILLTVKHTVQEYNCKLTRDIVELIDRETDLLTRGVKCDNLNGLKQRISTLFLQFCKSPEFNPEISRLLKVPSDPSSLRKNVYFCPSCNSYLPSSEFPTASNSRIIGRCKKCSKIDNDARLRQDFTKFRNMLRRLRIDEENYHDGSQIAFLIQDSDFHYLIENIWNGQSALSAWDNLHDLTILRWNKYEEWSPWNCILLTKDEAVAHLKLDSVNEGYGRIFVGKVHHRHVVARNYFSKLNSMRMNQNQDGVKQESIRKTQDQDVQVTGARVAVEKYASVVN